MARRAFVWLIQLGCFGFAAYFVGVFFWIAFSRVAFPFDLEWMEGAVVDHVREIFERGHVYVEPSLRFIPFIYNPVFYYFSAAAALVLGVDYGAPRAVSIASTAICFVLIYALCRRETGSRLAGVLGAGFYAATFELSDGWFDIGRVDALGMAFTFAAMYGVRFGTRPRHFVLAALAAVLAFGTKQSLLPLTLVLAVYVLCANGWRNALWFAVPAFGLTAVFVIGLHVATNGWYTYYVFLLPSGHPVTHTPKQWQLEVAGKLPIVLALGLAYFVNPGVRLQPKLFYGCVGGALVVIAYWSRAHSMSHINVNIPAHGAFALLSGLGAAAVLRTSMPSVVVLGAFAIVLQFELLRFDPRRFIPSKSDWAAVKELKDSIAAFPGEVFMPHHGHLTAELGKGRFAHEIALYDVERAKDTPETVRKKVREETAAAVAGQRFAAIILDYDATGYFPGLHRYYQQQSFGPTHPKLLYMLVGLRVRPSILFTPKK